MKSNRVLLAALRWFKSKRPLHWSLEDHLKQPVVNCRGEIEFELAEAVAESLRDKQQ